MIGRFNLLRRHLLTEEMFRMLSEVFNCPSVEFHKEAGKLVCCFEMNAHARGSLVFVKVTGGEDAHGGLIECDIVSFLVAQKGGGFVPAAIDDDRGDTEFVSHF